MALAWVVSFLLVNGALALEEVTAFNVSEDCNRDTNSFLRELSQDKPAEYAAFMYDAFGKMGSDTKAGNVNQPGSSQQCRSADGSGFSGRYCQVYLKQGFLEYFVGICVPDSCGEEDVWTLVAHDRLQFSQSGHMTKLIQPFPPILINQSHQEMIMVHCLLDRNAPDAYDVICLFICCSMIAVPLMATFFTALMRFERSKAVHSSVESTSLKSDLNFYGTVLANGSSLDGANARTKDTNRLCSSLPESCLPQSCGRRSLEAFSLQRTSQGIFDSCSSTTGGSYSSVNGIRVLSLLWIICGHSAQFPVINNLDNYKTWKKTVEGSPIYILTISGPIFLAVDTFLLLGGLLSTRSLMNSIDKAEDKLSAGLVANYLFKRIKRIQPLHLFIVCLTMSLISLLPWGPYWFPFIGTMMDCKTYWWANLLLISNLIPVQEICLPWTWYLSLDFQCYITTPLLVFFYKFNRRVFAIVAGGLLLVTTAASALATALLRLPVFHPSTMTTENYVLFYYVKPYTRYGPFLIGILIGIHLKTKKAQLLREKWQAACGWFCSLSVMAALVGTAYILKDTPSYPSVPHALYQALHRSLWALSVGWIIVACEEGYGGFVNKLLSFKLWVPLSNISFACYLVHPIFIIIYSGLQETPIHYTNFNFMYLFFGHLIPMLAASSILTVLVEKPYILLKSRSI